MSFNEKKQKTTGFFQKIQLFSIFDVKNIPGEKSFQAFQF